MSIRVVTAGLARASHPGPTVAVTLLTGLLAVAAGSSPGEGAVVVTAVAAGQLSIGWSNDLFDADRDRVAGRVDKPVARGQVGPGAVRRALATALVLAVVLSLLAGWRAAVVHLVLVVGAGWAYNLGLKSTPWSWVPYAVAFGALPAWVWLGVGAGGGWGPVGGSGAGGEAGWTWPPVWMIVVGALLGVGAHLLNALPDLDEDERTGIRGLPHRLGARRTRLLAPLLLLVGSAVVVWAPGGPVPGWAWLALALCVGLAVVAWTGRGRAPFVAAMALALVNVAGLLLRT